MSIKKLPNVLCWIRIALIPFILLFLLENTVSAFFSVPTRIVLSGVLFVAATLTDLLDGKIARKYDAVTNFGKFIDPIADKMLIISILVAFVEIGLTTSLPVIIVLAREFIVTGLRLGAMTSGKVVAANIWGKLKTVTQSVAIAAIYLILFVETVFDGSIINLSGSVSLIPQILVWVIALVTVVSAIPYIRECGKYIKD
ncbi:MAG: CDP-diacylglycerol--glycerol-3-phosphate 3-phosphatidyltransferase [Clostridiales bacterium]|nr:CDP-diacylglycerol--glycerol-3-phosphate 3-phosphatidyltransferase [Clostridiales bacterium]